MKLGKHVEGANGGVYSDRISSLPDELLGLILSALPTRCAVSTSILSKRWKYLFTLTNCLSFDDVPSCDDDDPEVEETDEQKVARKRRFQKFVNNVLELHQVPRIEKFSLVCQDTYDDSDWKAWISKAVQKGVQDLHCEVEVEHDVLPADLFMSQTLVTFKMTCFTHEKYDVQIPPSAWLPSLKVLHLEGIWFFRHEIVERLFTCCEMLEKLNLVDCNCDCDCDRDARCQFVVSTKLLEILTVKICSFYDGLFEIDAPNLARLSLKNNIGVQIVPSWKDSCSLAKAKLSFCCVEVDIVLIKAAADKVTELHLGANKLLLTLAGPEEMPVFRSLSSLHLCDCPFNESDVWKSVTSLLDKCPKLETVTFKQCFFVQGNRGDANVSPSNEEQMPFSCHAKVIEVYDFIGGEWSLLYLGNLLRNAGNLKRLILHRHHYGSTACLLQIKEDFNRLRSLPRTSKYCCIELND